MLGGILSRLCRRFSRELDGREVGKFLFGCGERIVCGEGGELVAVMAWREGRVECQASGRSISRVATAGGRLFRELGLQRDDGGGDYFICWLLTDLIIIELASFSFALYTTASPTE